MSEATMQADAMAVSVAAERKLAALLGDAHHGTCIYSLIHSGAPASKARARWSRRSQRFYTPAGTESAQEALAWEIKAALRGATLAGPVAIVAVFYRPNYQRIDADNLMKLVMDAMTKAGAWVDDCYVVAQASFIELDVANPRTELAFCTTKSTMDRDRRFTCARCGALFTRAGTATFSKPPKFCSRACHLAAYAADRGQACCPKCEKVFDRGFAGQKYCSRACSDKSPYRRPKTTLLRPWPKCQQCGGRVSRREYVRCAACAPKGRRLGSKNKPKGPRS